MTKLEDRRPIGRFLLALTKGPLGLLVEMVTDRLRREGPLGTLAKIVKNGVLTIRQNCNGRGANN